MRFTGVVTLHGMGDTKPDYANDLENRLNSALGQFFKSRVVFRSIFYQDVLQDKQDKIWADMAQKHRLRWENLRKLMLYGFSDAGTLEHRAHLPDSSYVAVQDIIRSTLRALYRSLKDENKYFDHGLILIAHSLGGQVLSNYIYDSDNADNDERGGGIWKVDPLRDVGQEERDFLRLKTKSLIVTTGCNIPLFVSGLKEIVPIDASEYRWVNYYDQDDVLGWPLGPLSEAYDELVKDEAVSAAGSMSGTPLDHLHYWDSTDVVERIAEQVEVVVRG